MPTDTRHTASGHPARLLTPAILALLKQIRPAQVGGVIEELRYYQRLREAFQLLDEFFPEAIQQYGHMQQVRDQFTLDEQDYKRETWNIGWWQVLAHFFNLLEEQDVIQINWAVANQACSYWAAPEYPDRGSLFATYLSYIPLQLHGLTHEETLLKCPPMELFHALLADCDFKVVSADILTQAELYDALDEWGESDRAAAWRFLHRIEANPGIWPAPIRQIPELARYSCHKTDNLILDQTFNPYSGQARQSGPWLTWANHLTQVAASWKRAKPVLHWFQRLMAWYDDEPGRLSALAQFIIDGAELERRPQPPPTTTIVTIMEDLIYDLEF